MLRQRGQNHENAPPMHAQVMSEETETDPDRTCATNQRSRRRLSASSTESAMLEPPHPTVSHKTKTAMTSLVFVALTAMAPSACHAATTPRRILKPLNSNCVVETNLVDSDGSNQVLQSTSALNIADCIDAVTDRSGGGSDNGLSGTLMEWQLSDDGVDRFALSSNIGKGGRRQLSESPEEFGLQGRMFTGRQVFDKEEYDESLVETQADPWMQEGIMSMLGFRNRQRQHVNGDSSQRRLGQGGRKESSSKKLFAGEMNLFVMPSGFTVGSAHIKDKIYHIMGGDRIMALDTASLPPESENHIEVPSVPQDEVRRLQEQAKERQRRLQGAISYVDVLIPYTKRALCHVATGERAFDTCDHTNPEYIEAMHARVSLGMVEANQGLEASGITDKRFRLAHTYMVDPEYDEASFTYDKILGDIAYNDDDDTVDSGLNDVHDIRDQYGADIVSFWTDNSVNCGLAYKGYPVVQQWAFSAVFWQCATGYYSFAHELTHLMGASHDRGGEGCTVIPDDSDAANLDEKEDVCCGSDPDVEPKRCYAYGFQDYASGDYLFRSILSYACFDEATQGQVNCPRVNMFSQPDEEYQFQVADLANPGALSINESFSIGNSHNNNAKLIDDIWPVVAEYRDEVPGISDGTGAETPVTAPPSTSPTEVPTKSPTKTPTLPPTDPPTKAPTKSPTLAPTESPTPAPTTKSPTKAPTDSPTSSPTESPTPAPTTKAPTKEPTKNPTETPVKEPSQNPTEEPTGPAPSTSPSVSPTEEAPVPIAVVTPNPSEQPSVTPPGLTEVTSSPSTGPTVDEFDGSSGFIEQWLSNFQETKQSVIDEVFFNAQQSTQSAADLACGDGVCDAASGETCDTCSQDCPGGTVDATCGNGICEVGENCLTCAGDCAGRLELTGSDDDFCCQGGPVDAPATVSLLNVQATYCSDPRCSLGTQCDASDYTFCCGNGTCEPGETSGSCAADCNSCNRNGQCDDGEDDTCPDCVATSTKALSTCLSEGETCGGVLPDPCCGECSFQSGDGVCVDDD